MDSLGQPAHRVVWTSFRLRSTQPDGSARTQNAGPERDRRWGSVEVAIRLSNIQCPASDVPRAPENSPSILHRRRGGSRRRGRLLGHFRLPAVLTGALEADGGLPGGEFLGVLAVEVAEGGVEAAAEDVGFAAGLVQGGGAGHAGLVVDGLVEVLAVDGVAVAAEGGHEAGRHQAVDELLAKRGLGGQGFGGIGLRAAGHVFEEGEEGVGVALDDVLGAVGREGEGAGVEAGFALGDGAGGLGDGLEQVPELVAQGDRHVGDGIAQLTHAGGGEQREDGLERGEIRGGGRVGRPVGAVFGAEDVDAFVALLGEAMEFGHGGRTLRRRWDEETADEAKDANEDCEGGD